MLLQSKKLRDFKTSKLIVVSLYDWKTESDDCFGYDFPEGIQRRQGEIVWLRQTTLQLLTR